MKIRWKFFSVLLAFSLIPILILLFTGIRIISDLGQKIRDGSIQTLTEMVSRELSQTANSYAELVGQQKRTAELAVLALAEEAGSRLEAPPDYSQPIYFSQYFDNPSTAPADAKLSERYPVRLSNGNQKPTLVSFEYPSIYLPPGVSRIENGPDIYRLARLNSFIRELTSFMSQDIFRVYVSLESGIHYAYPGHSGYPAGYDPRKRDWYLLGKSRDNVEWTPPMRDASTDQAVLTVVKRFLRQDGSVAGVAAMDVLVSHVLKPNFSNSHWGEIMLPFMVSVETNPQTGRDGLLIVAKQDSLEYDRFWQPEWLDSTDTVAFQKLVDDLKQKGFGFINMPYQGVDSFWAYSTLDKNIGFLAILPQKVVDNLPREILQGHTRMIKWYRFLIAGIFLLVMASILLMAYLGSRSITKPLLALSQAWHRISQGDFSVRLPHRFNDERDQAFEAFNSLAPRLQEHLEMTKALELAQEVQQSLLPRSNPDIPGFDIAGISIYCDATGGDYYDFVPGSNTNSDKMAVVVGDVSGHGISSALLMATARALIRLRASMPGQTAAIVSDVNRLLAQDTYRTGQFMTLFYSELDPGLKRIAYVRAGHDPAIVYDTASGEFKELKGKGLAMGVVEDFQYKEFDCLLSPGQIIVIGTDGIWEMHSPSGQMFGKDALKTIIRENAGTSAQDILETVKNTLTQFRGNRRTEDDITMVVIKVIE